IHISVFGRSSETLCEENIPDIQLHISFIFENLFSNSHRNHSHWFKNDHTFYPTTAIKATYFCIPGFSKFELLRAVDHVHGSIKFNKVAVYYTFKVVV